MRKGAKIFISIFLPAALLAAAALVQPEDDLDWIRRYGPKERVTSGAPGYFGSRAFNSRWHRFTFKSIPPKFVEELNKRTEYHAVGNSYHFNGTFPDTDRIILEPESNSVLVWMHEKEDLLARGQRTIKGLVCLK